METNLIEPVVINSEDSRVEYIKFRLTRMAQSKSVVNTKFQLQKQLYEVFEKHLTEGEDWNASIRFPELFGSIQRKAADLIESLPEVRIHSTKPKSKDFTIGAQAVYEQQENLTNSRRERIRCIYDTLFYGIGILAEGYGQTMNNIIPAESNDTELKFTNSALTEVCVYDGLISERIDPRDFYIDDAAEIFSDETGVQGASDCCRRRIYSEQSWKEKFAKFKNFDKVIPTAWGVSISSAIKFPTEKESQEFKTSSRVYEVIEYWNRSKDWLVLVANGIEIYFGANPYKHKRLPFVIYYNYRRDDSVWGISETEILAPFIYAKEEINNLMLKDAKLALQPAIAVSGDAQFNEEENELQPGAIFTLRGIMNGKVQDNIMPLRFGGIPAETQEVFRRIEDSQIITTGDDIRALYSNPGQLATQTLAKRDSAQKRVKSNIIQNTLESERIRAQIRFSNIVQFITKPYQTLTGKVAFRKIRIDGYEVKQDSDEARPYFNQKYGAQGVFVVNEKMMDGMEESVEIEVIDVQMQEQLKQQELDDMIRFLDISSKVPGVLQGMNPLGLAKQIAKKMNIDYYEVFPDAVDEDNEDISELMIDLIMTGDEPEYNGEVNPEKLSQRLREFKRTMTFKRSNEQIKKVFNEFLIKVQGFTGDWLKRKLKDKLLQEANNQSGQAGQLPQQIPAGGVSVLPGGNVQPGGAEVSQPGGGTSAVQTRMGLRGVVGNQTNP